MNYSQKVMDHFRNPRNFGQIEDPDGVGTVGNPACGDVMRLYLNVSKSENGEDVITDIKFETFGCGAAIATSSIITEMAKDKPLEKALKIKGEDVVNELGDLPQAKIHCSLLAADALAEAIYYYWQSHKKSIPSSLKKRHEYNQRRSQVPNSDYIY